MTNTSTLIKAIARPRFFSGENNLLLFIFALTFTFSSAQTKYGNTWYFSTSRGIDFNSGTAVLLTTSGMSEYEGCSAISSATTGMILMYTDGMSVWGANHQVMPNGSGLQSTYAAGQQGLIVPDPGDTNKYYLFTSGEYFSGGTDGYRYNIIDMTLNGGLGDVTATKNVLIYSPASEKLCAIMTATGDGYWVATHEFNSNNFQIYKLTTSGLSSPVTSSAGTVFTGVNPDGCMKFSADGKRICLSLGGSNEAEVFDFNDTTGEVTNPINVGPVAQTFPYTYGVCISPDATRLYVTEENDNHLYQYDLTLGNQVAINASKTAVGTSGSYAMQTMQVAPDGKMYVARNGGAYLAVVNFPDSLGVACNFVDNGFYLNGGASSYGLPNFPENTFAPDIPPSQFNHFAASDTMVCEKFCVNFFDSSLNNPTSWLWLFTGGNPSSSTVQNPMNICYNFPGTYDVTLITTSANGNDTLTLANFITVNPTPPAPTITQIGYILTSSFADTYQWQFNTVDISGATNQSYTVTQTGFYTVYAGDSNGCKNLSTVYVQITGVDEVGGDQNVFISPNPSDGNFMVELFNGLASGEMAENISIQVVNELGQEVFSSSEKINGTDWSAGLHSEKKEIDLTNVAGGVYFIGIKSENILVKKKLMIIH